MILMRRIFQSNAAFGKWQCKEVFLSFARCISVKLLFAFVWTEKNTENHLFHRGRCGGNWIGLLTLITATVAATDMLIYIPKCAECTNARGRTNDGVEKLSE